MYESRTAAPQGFGSLRLGPCYGVSELHQRRRMRSDVWDVRRHLSLTSTDLNHVVRIDYRTSAVWWASLTPLYGVVDRTQSIESLYVLISSGFGYSQLSVDDITSRVGSDATAQSSF